MDPASVVFWACFFAALVLPGSAAYYLFFASWTFGSLAVIPPAIIGMNLTPAWVSACLLVVKTILQVGPGNFSAAALDPKRFGLFTVCMLYAVGSAMVLPRLFAGHVDVIVMRLVTASAPEPLQPSTANFTQTFYFIVTYLATISLYFAASEIRSRHALFNAFRFGALVAILSGVADFVTLNTGTKALLAPFRTALYTIESDAEVLNVKRVIGLSTEPSSYAALCMSFLGFLLLASSRPKGLGGPLSKWLLCFGLAVAIYMSTSSGGVVGLAALLAVSILVLGINSLRMRASAFIGFFVLGWAACSIFALWLWQPAMFAQPIKLINVMVFEKHNSGSYVERSMWNSVSYQAFLHTYGLGVGLGGARASSWIYAILSNIGVPGALFLALFLLQVTLGRGRQLNLQDRDLLQASKFALFPNLFIASLSGTSVGFGLGAAFVIGVSTGLLWPLPKGAAKAPSKAKRPLGGTPRPFFGPRLQPTSVARLTPSE